MWENFTGKTLFSPCNDLVRDYSVQQYDNRKLDGLGLKILPEFCEIVSEKRNPNLLICNQSLSGVSVKQCGKLSLVERFVEGQNFVIPSRNLPTQNHMTA